MFSGPVAVNEIGIIMKYLIFTDLDGTLLNHDDYSFANAIPMLDYCKSHKIPVILTTSKTRSEIEGLQKEMGISDPFIVENGAAVFFGENFQDMFLSQDLQFGKYFIKKLGLEYKKIREFAKQKKEDFALRCFGDMSIEEISRYTGLSEDDCTLAKNREFTEPFLIEDDSKMSELAKEANKEGIKITKGGRFYHFIGIRQDKGEALKLATQILKMHYKTDNVKTIGLGDSYNDIPLFNAVDIPILIPNFKNSFTGFFNNHLIKARFTGSKGWNDSLKRIFHEL